MSGVSHDEVLHMYESANHLVNQATSLTVVKPGEPLEPDWETNMRICDMINSSTRPDILSVVVIKCVETQIKTQSGNPRVMWFVLLLLETLVKNCGTPFHNAMCNKEFMKKLEKLGGKRIFKPKRVFPRPTTAQGFLKARVQEKVLSLFQAWGPLHRGELPLYEHEVEKLKRKGVMFPAPKPEDLAPYERGTRGSSSTNRSPSTRGRSGSGASSSPSPSQHKYKVSVPDNVRQVVEEIESVITLFESLVNANSADEIQSDDLARELSEDLNKKHKPKLTELIEKYVVQGDDERLLSMLFSMLERTEQGLLKYDVLMAGGDISEIFSDSKNQYEEDEEDWEEDWEDSDEEQVQRSPQQQNKSTDPLESLEQLAISKKTRGRRASNASQPTPKEEKDEILEWILSNIPNTVPSAPSVSPARVQPLQQQPLQPEKVHLVAPPIAQPPPHQNLPFAPPPAFAPLQPQPVSYPALHPVYQSPQQPQQFISHPVNPMYGQQPTFQPTSYAQFSAPPQYNNVMTPTFQPLSPSPTNPFVQQQNPNWAQFPANQQPTFQPTFQPTQQQVQQFNKPQQTPPQQQQPFDPRH